MTTVDDLVGLVAQYQPRADSALLRRAAEVAAASHAGQRRQSGEPFLQHPLEVASLLTRLRLDLPSICAGLLHDTVEDTSLTIADVRSQFGEDIGRLVDGVSKIGKLEVRTHEARQAENFRKMILSMAQDIRVVLIKLADRLHNMRTLGVLPEERQRRIAQETLEIYAPLANRLGIEWLRTELEDLCFRYLHPDIYAQLAVRIAKTREAQEHTIQVARARLLEALAQEGLPGEVLGRTKHLYGVYQKMLRQAITPDEVYDIMGLRVITETKMHCYAILGLIHSLWRPVPGRFRDYVGVPRSNLYQSLHTTVVGPDSLHVECQIRTREMHQIAEEGIAAHWKYKERGQIDEKDSRLFAWLRQLVEWEQELTDDRLFMDSVKRELVPDVVYVFTPKGDVKELARGATSLDCAFAVHTEIGIHCVGARVNRKLVPLRYELQSGDTVEVLTSPSATPSRDWLALVKTARARARIKHWLKGEERKQGLEMGRKLLERELRRRRLSLSSLHASSAELASVLKERGVATLEDLMIAISYGRVSAQQVVHRLLPEAQRQTVSADASPEAGKTIEGPRVKVRGLGDVLTHISKCCTPLPGDRILGYITRGRGLSIHTMDCPNLDQLDYDRDRLLEVDWDAHQPAASPVAVSVFTMDRPGLLASISASISLSGTNIVSATSTTTPNKKAHLHFVVEARDAGHLGQIVKNIQQVDGVLSVQRVQRAIGRSSAAGRRPSGLPGRSTRPSPPGHTEPAASEKNSDRARPGRGGRARGDKRPPTPR